MTPKAQPIFIGETPQKQVEKKVRGEYVPLLGELFYRMENFDAIEPFFMSIVSGSDHWLFVSSTGGLTAGRVSAEQSIFPYYTVDKITENNETTGNKAILLVTRAGRTSLWEPLSDRQRGSYAINRNLYKNVSGTALVFEEQNIDLGLTYRYAWRTSEKFGFVKTTWLLNSAGSDCRVEVLDGLQNILPANVTSVTQNTFSPLLDAYKRSELHKESGLAIFALNSTLTDLAEPSESLLATTVTQVGLTPADFLLSSTQLERFRAGQELAGETEIRGQRGAYFVHAVLELAAGQEREWHLLADTNQDSAAIARKIAWLRGEAAGLSGEIEADIQAGQQGLWEIVAAADGVQLSTNELYTAHHFANAMFNVMRGGIFADQYWIRTADLIEFVSVRNRPALQANLEFFKALPDRLHVSDLQARAQASGSVELIRLCYAYLPLIFSRRHGDPSRPWNRFAINIKKPDGSLRIDYEGNWRDIFQNWEALAYSYPEFVESMISTFLNATTADGYNPYRITHAGIEWEHPEPGNPWANIGYWSDHQIVYLQKLMEISVKVHPGRLADFLSSPVFSYSNVPYQIKPYADLLKDPYNTISFNWELQKKIEARQPEYGTDAKLVLTPGGQVLQVSLAEKLLVLLLAKFANFVPEGGIWMSTQRPEWNDANNALVGKGLSVVTLSYLRPTLVFCRDLFSQSSLKAVPLNAEVRQLLERVHQTLVRFSPVLQGSFSDQQRRELMDALGTAGSDYRWGYYQNGFAGQLGDVPLAEISAFLELALDYVNHSLRANKRSDSLYQAYNILHLGEARASVSSLYEMLEGQVAVLASGLLNGEESLAMLRALRNSRLYQPEQHSYILYPDRVLPGFLEKNTLTAEQVQGVGLLAMMAAGQDPSIINRDINGAYHFNGLFRNFHDVNRALESLKAQPRYAGLVAADFQKIQDLFEATFHHNEFTGRSGSFFAYEGLGSVYWHMVTKLLLAVRDTALRLRQDACAPALVDCFMEIRESLSFNKSPDVYGAFPTDPYSHTPKGQGAKQPGMTGSVKEVILTRQAELGYFIVDGRLVFDLWLLDRQELLAAPALFTYLDVSGQSQKMELKAGSLAYTICQTPVILESAGAASLTVRFANGKTQTLDGSRLDDANTRHIFLRDGLIQSITVAFPR